MRGGGPLGLCGCSAPKGSFPFCLFSVNTAGHRGIATASRVDMKHHLVTEEKQKQDDPDTHERGWPS